MSKPYFKEIECVYATNEWFCLWSADKKKSRIGIIFKAIYFTMLMLSIWIIFESLYTAQIGFHVNGLFAAPNTVIIKSAHNIGVTASNYLVLTTELQKIFVSQFLIVVVIMPITVQILIVFVWFIPLKIWLCRWFMRIIFVLQALNCMEVYFVSALLCFEFEDYTKWFSANKGGSPELCGPDSVAYKEMGGCIYADPFFNVNGVILMLFACIVQWISFVYTMRTANKIGINVIRFGKGA